jgi:UDP-galactopyranose mutase
VGRVLIVGAGMSGATAARVLADLGFSCLVVEQLAHVAGHAHTSPDADTGIMVHRYGPHIFHTDNPEVWNFVSRFGEWIDYRHKVFVKVNGKVFRLPINLHTLNQFFGRAMSPAEARHLVSGLAVPNDAPSNFEEQALAMVGSDLYEAFLKGYTTKQWGMSPAMLPPSVLRRLPLRFNYDDNYFHHERQAMPRDGYTAIIESMLDHPSIEVACNTSFESIKGSFLHTIYSGPIDRFFGFGSGMLGYRTLDFEERRSTGDILGTAVMNYADADVPWTRETEHHHLSPWRTRSSAASIVWREFSRQAKQGDPLFYPLRQAGDQTLLERYVSLARSSREVTFLGRLGCYAYLDMDQAIERAMATAEHVAECLKAGKCPRPFVHDPILHG